MLWNLSELFFIPYLKIYILIKKVEIVVER